MNEDRMWVQTLGGYAVGFETSYNAKKVGVVNEVIERMAKAAFEKFYGGWEEKPAWPPEYFDSELRSADDWRDAMRDVLRAMREPTVEMTIVAGRDTVYHYDPRETWTLMIDEALRE